MFDPDVLDPFVKQHGIDKYGLIIRSVKYFKGEEKLEGLTSCLKDLLIRRI
jgi:hypothetical protein